MVENLIQPQRMNDENRKSNQNTQTMKTENAIKTIKQFNAWRKSDKDTPKELTNALETAVVAMQLLEQLNNQSILAALNEVHEGTVIADKLQQFFDQK
jgi:hypothetical protein